MAKNSQNHNVSSSPDAPKSWWKSKVGRILKNTLYGATAALTLMWSTSCSNWASWNIDPKQNTTEVVINKPKFFWIDVLDRAITENLDWIVLCENPETKKFFLSDWNKKLTEDFDDIKKIWRFDGTLYFVWVNGWEHAIVNEEWDIIFSWLDEIDGYTIGNWYLSVSGKVNWETYRSKTKRTKEVTLDWKPCPLRFKYLK